MNLMFLIFMCVFWCWDLGVHFEARDRQDDIHACTIAVVMIWWDGYAECWVCYRESATPLEAA